MEKNEIKYPKEIRREALCFCCKKVKEGNVIDNRFVYNDCNHLPDKIEKEQ